MRTKEQTKNNKHLTTRPAFGEASWLLVGEENNRVTPFTAKDMRAMLQETISKLCLILQKYQREILLVAAIFALLAVIGLIGLYYSFVRENAAFDPVQILGLSPMDIQLPNATKIIKKAVRRLERKYHPGKHYDDPNEAKRQFFLVADAFEALIDDYGLLNTRLYGHPHGSPRVRMWRYLQHHWSMSSRRMMNHIHNMFPVVLCIICVLLIANAVHYNLRHYKLPGNIKSLFCVRRESGWCEVAHKPKMPTKGKTD